MKCNCGGIHAAGLGDTSTGHSVFKVKVARVFVIRAERLGVQGVGLGV